MILWLSGYGHFRIQWLSMSLNEFSQLCPRTTAIEVNQMIDRRLHSSSKGNFSYFFTDTNLNLDIQVRFAGQQLVHFGRQCVLIIKY